MKYFTAIASLLLLPICTFTQAADFLEPNSDEVTFNGPNVNWRQEYKRAAHPKRDPNIQARSPEKYGKSPFIVQMCRGADQTDCDDVWVATSNHCFDNAHWFGWTTSGQTPKSVKIVGKTCCGFYGVKDCDDAGRNLGWLTKVCEGDTGNDAVIQGVPLSYMCNVPYGSGGEKQNTYGSEVLPLPTSAAA